MNELAKVEGSQLTEQQERLIAVLSGEDEASTDDAGSSTFRDDREIAKAAGYSSTANMRAATRSPQVQARLQAARTARLKGDLAAKAMQAMEQLITSEKTPAATKYSAAKWVLEQAGHGASQIDLADKPLAEMSEQELLAFMRKAQEVVDRGGEPPIITVTPHNGA